MRKFQNEGNQRDLFDKGTLLFLREEERKLILKNNSTCRFYVLSCVLSVRTILDILWIYMQWLPNQIKPNEFSRLAYYKTVSLIRQNSNRPLRNVAPYSWDLISA